MTYIKYAKREATDYVDWGAIGKGMVDMLNEENRIREEKKAKIDEETRLTVQKLSDSPQGKHQSINNAVVDFSDSGKEFLLMNERLFKSGQLSTKDYLRNKQNLNDGTDQFYAIAKDYNVLFDERMERMKTGVSGVEEAWAMEMMETFTKFDKSRLYVNPTTGLVSVAELDENGNMTDNFQSLDSLKRMADTKFDKYDVLGNIAKGVAGVDEDYDANWARTDAKMREGYENYRDTYVESMLTNPHNTLSVLADYIGGYTPTRKKDEAGGTNVYMKFDEATGIYTPEFTDEQLTIAKEALKVAFDQQIKVKKKEVIDRTPKPPGGRGSGKNEKKVIGDLIEIFSSNNPTTVGNRLTSVGGSGKYQDREIRSVKRSGDGMLTIKVEGISEPIERDLSKMSAYEAAKTLGEIFYGITDVNEALLASGYTKEQIERMKGESSDVILGQWEGDDVEIDLTLEEKPKEEEETPKNQAEILRNWLTDTVGDGDKLIRADNGKIDEDAAVKKIKQLLGKAGLQNSVKVLIPFDPGDDVISIGGVEIDLESPTAMSDIIDQLVGQSDFMSMVQAEAAGKTKAENSEIIENPTEEQYNALKSGDKYIYDGKEYTKQ